VRDLYARGRGGGAGMTRHSRDFKPVGTQHTVRQHSATAERLRNGAWVTKPTFPAGLTTRPVLCFSPDSLECSAISGGAGWRRRVETLGCNVLSETDRCPTHSREQTHTTTVVPTTQPTVMRAVDGATSAVTSVSRQRGGENEQ